MSSRNPSATAAAIVVENLSKTFHARHRGTVTALDDVGFAIPPGQVVGLLGANGAGKTTTLKCIGTLIRPSRGRIVVHGVDTQQRPRDALRHVSLLLEGNRNIYWPLSPKENLDFFAGLNGIAPRSARASRDQLLALVGLEHVADTPCRALSRGMQQRVALAAALIRRTACVLLDEPTLGLDVASSHDLRTFLLDLARHDQRSLIVSSHDMHLIQSICERVIIMHDGRVVADDNLADLLQVFRASAYQCRVIDLPDSAEAGLRERFPDVRIARDSSGASIELEAADPTRVYEFIDVLRHAHAVIESIQRRTPSLEDVFLTLATKP